MCSSDTVPGPWQPVAVSDVVLSLSRPGAYFLDFPRVRQQGTYEAFRDETGNCFLVLDGQEFVRWVQRPEGIQWAHEARRGASPWILLQKGEYLFLGQSAGPGDHQPRLSFFLQRHQEYELPEAWPAGEPVPA